MSKSKLSDLYGGRDRVLKLKYFRGIDYLIDKLSQHQARQRCDVVIDYIIPACNIEPEHFERRLYNIQFIIDHQLAVQTSPVNIVLVEQQLDKNRERFADHLEFGALSHQIIHRSYPTFCKGWLQNIAVQETQNPFFILGETDTFTLSPTYCADLVKFCETQHLSWCIGWNKILYVEESQVHQLKSGVLPTEVSLTRTPKRGGAEGGMVIFERKFWKNEIYGADETYKGLGGMDNELAYRSRKASGQYVLFPHVIYHLWHPICCFKKSDQRKKNAERYFKLIRESEWQIVSRALQQSNLGGDIPLDIGSLV